jgi:hypothetical protein
MVSESFSGWVEGGGSFSPGKSGAGVGFAAAANRGEDWNARPINYQWCLAGRCILEMSLRICVEDLIGRGTWRGI